MYKFNLHPKECCLGSTIVFAQEVKMNTTKIHLHKLPFKLILKARKEEKKIMQSL